MKPLSTRGLLAVLALTWLASGCFLLAAWRSGVDDRQMRNAPLCAQSQLFTPADCQIELYGTLTDLTTRRAQLDIGGRHLIMDIAALEDDHPEMAGNPVRVTLYRGRPVRIEGDRLTAEANDLPEDDRVTFGFFGLFCLAAGPVNFALALALRKHTVGAQVG
jgi:hypothetical protein